VIVAQANSRFEDLLAFQCKALGFPAPERQYLFAKTLGRKFVADFCWVAQKLICEVNGGIWKKGGGAHSRPANIQRDVEKAQAAIVLGYTLLPVTTDQVRKGEAVKLLESVLKARGWVA
jgi:very-short-patch-repair endonuclease